MPSVHPHKENSQSTSKLNQICANFQTEFEYVIYFHARRRNRRSRHEFDPIWVDFYFIAWVFGHRMSIMSNFSIGNALNNRFRTGNSKCSIKKKKNKKKIRKGNEKDIFTRANSVATFKFRFRSNRNSFLFLSIRIVIPAGKKSTRNWRQRRRKRRTCDKRKRKIAADNNRSTNASDIEILFFPIYCPSNKKYKK